jgi:hypothetical protein
VSGAPVVVVAQRVRITRGGRSHGHTREDARAKQKGTQMKLGRRVETSERANDGGMIHTVVVSSPVE